MLDRSTLQVLSLVMAVAFPCSLVMADAQPALLHLNGTAKVNGREVTRQVAVFPGDAIQTGKDSGGTVTMDGASLTLAPQSSAVHDGKAWRLIEGSILVSASRELRVTAARFTVTPVSGQKARFHVTLRNGTLEVSALEGSAAVSDGKAVTLVEPGTSLTASAGGDALPQPPRKHNSLSSEAALIIAISAAIAVGVGVGIANAANESPTSP